MRHPAGRLILAYVCAVLCGVTLVNAAIALFSAAVAPDDPDVITQSMGETIKNFALVTFAIQFPACALLFLPFTTLYVFLCKRCGQLKRTAFIWGGSLTPLVSLVVAGLAFDLLRSGLDRPVFLIVSLILGLASIPAGTIAGYVLWRLGFRPVTRAQYTSVSAGGT